MSATSPPPACPTCAMPRTWDADPSDEMAEEFAWCESCAIGAFPEGVPIQEQLNISEPWSVSAP